MGYATEADGQTLGAVVADFEDEVEGPEGGAGFDGEDHGPDGLQADGDMPPGVLAYGESLLLSHAGLVHDACYLTPAAAFQIQGTIIRWLYSE